MAPNPTAWLILILIVVPLWAALVYLKAMRRRTRRLLPLMVSLPLVLLGSASLWLFCGRKIPAQSARLFREPVSAIQSVQIVPVSFRSLARHCLTVTNEDQINGIMTAIRSAKNFFQYFPNHSSDLWQCKLVVSSASGNSYLDVAKNSGTGVVFRCRTSPSGFTYCTCRSETLGAILEKAALNENVPSREQPGQTSQPTSRIWLDELFRDSAAANNTATNSGAMRNARWKGKT